MTADTEGPSPSARGARGRQRCAELEICSSVTSLAAGGVQPQLASPRRFMGAHAWHWSVTPEVAVGRVPPFSTRCTPSAWTRPTEGEGIGRRLLDFARGW